LRRQNLWHSLQSLTNVGRVAAAVDVDVILDRCFMVRVSDSESQGEQDIFASAQSGSRAGAELLYAAWKAWLAESSRRHFRTLRAEEVADVAHDVLVGFLTGKIRFFSTVQEARSYLRTTVYWRLREESKRKASYSRALSPLTPEPTERGSGTSDSAAFAARLDAEDEIICFLRQLPETQIRMIEALEVEHLTRKEVCAELRISSRTLERWIREVRRRWMLFLKTH
jgi:DNA-directed RNA polymerase specialized sigma24 family protein